MSGQDESSQPVRPMVSIDNGMDPRSEGELPGAPSGNIMPMELVVSGSEPDGVVEIGAEAGSAPTPPEDPEDDTAEQDEEPKRIAPSPVLPSAAEIEDHRICHYPYRNWCRHCVAGRALGERRGMPPRGWEY